MIINKYYTFINESNFSLGWIGKKSKDLLTEELEKKKETK